jgi:hypothetical protein
MAEKTTTQRGQLFERNAEPAASLLQTELQEAYGMWSLIKYGGPCGRQYASLAPSMMLFIA